MSTREVWEARRELEQVDAEYRKTTGVYRTRREHAKARLDKATEEQSRLQSELDRLIYTLNAAYGVQLGQQTLTPPPREGLRTTFIVKTSQTALRNRIRDLRRRLNEAPG